jgi:predicted amidohydrolase/CubicO group peptidase (beta-lactamase class C family)
MQMPLLASAMTVVMLYVSEPMTSSGTGSPDMIFPGVNWERAPPEALGIDPKRLADAIAFLEANAGSDGVRQLVIVRHGRIVHEGPEAGVVHGVWSMTKSFTSTVLGLLIDEGECSLDSHAADFAPELAEHYGDVTLRHFTTMTSGYRAVGDEPRGGYSHGPSRTPLEPGPEPLFEPPGSHYAYWDSAMNEFALVMTRIAGEPIEELFKRRIADPIGLEHWSWGDLDTVDIGGMSLVVNGGSGNSNRHIEISALEAARFGHLFLNGGEWRGQQLVSSGWVEAATRKQVAVTTPWAHPESAIDGRGVYGFNWWTNDVTASGRRKWPGAPAGTFSASGYNNNDLFVIPAWGVVVARLGLDQRDGKITDEVYGEFLKRLGGAVRADHQALEDWRVSSPREEIAPIAWLDESVRCETRATFALAGNGRESTNGCWTRSLDVEAGTHVAFETRYRARDIGEPLRCVLARVLWRDVSDNRVGQAEYPATRKEDVVNGWTPIRQVYRVPEGAVRADVELILRWDADGTVFFDHARLQKASAPPPRTVRLASVHHRPRGGTGPRNNLEKFAPFIATAAERRADIVCLPEGITVCGTGKSYVDVAEPVPGPSTRYLGGLARKHSLAIVAGIYERDGKAVYNTAVLIDRAGRLTGRYRKVCLPREEIEGGITPGDEIPVFDTEFGRIGLMICWDVFFPEPARELARKGAEVIFLPIWGGNLRLARARAIENQVFLVSSTYDMKTAVFDREGEIVAEATADDPVIVVEVDLAEQKLWPWLGDFRNRIPREKPAARALGASSD